MSPTQMLLEVIDPGSFSSLWFWLALAALWTGASYSVLGVPYDMVRRAAVDGRTQEDLEVLVRIRVDRLRGVSAATGPWIVALGALVATTLALLGFGYRVEIAQALFLMGFPFGLVALMAARAAHRIAKAGLRGAGLRRLLLRHRRWVQTLRTVSIFVTALWGMYRNFAAGPFGP